MGEEAKEDVSTQMMEPLHIQFAFKKPDDYKMHFVNGAYGGLTPHGDLVCNFFFEYKNLPESEDAIVTDGKITSVESSPSSEIIRELKVGIIITPSEARIIARWLNDKVDEYEKAFR